ncbi:MAG: hypothetical protein ABIR71_02885 [Chthoniobacterales bacterium]
MRLLLVVVLALSRVAASSAAEKAPGRTVPLVAPSQIIDATHLNRRNPGEVEVVILNLATGKEMTFQVERKPVAKIRSGHAFRFFLTPGRYRFGIIPTHQVPLTPYWEMRADVKGAATQLYRIFQSSGFTSSGGNASYEIAFVPGD